MSKTLQAVGSEMSNVAYNWAQSPGRTLTEQDCAMLKELGARWDDAQTEALRAKRANVSCGNFITVVLAEGKVAGIPTQGTRLFDGNGTELSGVTLVSLEGAVDSLWKVKLEAFVQIKRASEV